jgi:hypothetical protein
MYDDAVRDVGAARRGSGADGSTAGKGGAAAGAGEALDERAGELLLLDAAAAAAAAICDGRGGSGMVHRRQPGNRGDGGQKAGCLAKEQVQARQIFASRRVEAAVGHYNTSAPNTTSASKE